MNKINKILLFFVLGLFFVLAFELFIYFNNKNQKSSADILPASNPQVIVTPTPFPDAAINPDMLRAYAILHKSVVVSSTAVNIYRGKITVLDSPQPNALRIRFEAQDGKSNAFVFSAFQLKKIQFFKLGDHNQETPIKQDELKLGNQITLTITNDLTKPLPNNIISGKIVKLN